MTRTGLYCHECGPEEGLVVADGIVRSHEGVYVTGLVPGEYPHLDLFLKGGGNLRVRVAGGFHHAGAVAPAAGLAHGGFYHALFRIGHKRRIAAVLEFPVEGLLEVFPKVLSDSLFRVTLHLYINCGIDAEAVAVKIVRGAVALGVLVEPAVERVVRPQEGVHLIVFLRLVA